MARFAEELFPIKEVSDLSSAEKNIRQGHISTLHMWWARRPLASSRAMNYAALIDYPTKSSEVESKKEFIVKLARWENSLDSTILDTARKDILRCRSTRPKILDPFAGGGSIPLESLRLGCETYCSDYNPVAVLLQKCTIEYPLTYKEKLAQSMENFVLEPEKKNEKKSRNLEEDILSWKSWLLEQVTKEIGSFYDVDDEGYSPVAFIWSKTIVCQNPSCGAEIPLLRNLWLVNKKDKKIALFPMIVRRGVEFEIVGAGHSKFPHLFDPNKGTVSKGIANCLVCGSVSDNKWVRRAFVEGTSMEKLLCVILVKKSISGKKYRIASKSDFETFDKCKAYLGKKSEQLLLEWGINPVPDEPLPPIGTLGFRIQRYGMKSWGDIFNPRQKLVLITFIEMLRKANLQMLKESYEENYAKVVTTYLALAIDKIPVFNSKNAQWQPSIEKISNAFGKSAVPMTWSYPETNPLIYTAGSFETAVSTVINSLKKLTLPPGDISIKQFSATSIPFESGYFDAVLTDPPYYDNIPYSYLSDFFYVWLKRSVGNLYPELFSTPLTPKSNEVVAYPNSQGGQEAGKKFFEDMLKRCFQEISRVLKPTGVCVIVYAHKSNSGWETLINSLLDSRLVVTAAWPINTEMKERLRASESAALTSSIYLVAKKNEKVSIGFYKNVKDDLKNHLNAELDKLWREGISGADFFISAIGSAIEIFGVYNKIIDDAGNEIPIAVLLEHIRRIVTEYAVKQVLHNGFSAEISQLTRLYLLWRWAYGEAKVIFDDARKLAQSVGIDLSEVWNKGFIQKDKEYLRLLGPQDRKVKDLSDSKEMIDVLHMVLLLWNKGKSNEILELLEKSGFGTSDVFYRVSQAISESLPNESKEKKWLEGFLAGRIRIKKQMTADSVQKRLFE